MIQMAGNRQAGQVVAIIPAAGVGKRMGMPRPKQFLTIGNRPILAITLEAFERASLIDAVVLVVPESEIEYCEENVVKAYDLKKVSSIVRGGERRQDSVRLGLEATQGCYSMVVVHDGVRPFVASELIDKVVMSLREFRAVIAAVPARDTIKEVDGEGRILRTPERKNIWLAQTPQAFYYEDLMLAHNKAASEQWGELTDDAAFVEKLGIPVHVVMGSERNIKVTTPSDLELANFLWKP